MAWTIDFEDPLDDNYYIYDDEGKNVCMTYNHNDGCTYANLIAAVPQLLEACEGILMLFEEGFSLAIKEVDQRIFDVEAAIAASKGDKL